MKFISFLLFICFHALIIVSQAQNEVVLTKTSGDVIRGNLISSLEDFNQREIAISQDGSVSAIQLSEISSIISGDRAFFRFTLQVDKKSLIQSQLTQAKEPEFEIDTVLLEQIVSGPVNLYRLLDRKKREHFFIQTDQEVPVELIYTRYVKYDDNGRALPVQENNRFKTQLSKLFGTCGSVFALINEAEYNWSDLVGIIRTGSVECLGADEAVVIISEAPKALLETELSAGLGTGYLYLYGDQFPFDPRDANTSIRPGYWGSVAFAYYPTILKGKFALVTELGAFNLTQIITAQDFTSEDIYKNYLQNIDYHYLCLNLILRKIMKGKYLPFWQAGYSYGYAYSQSNPLEEEIFFYGVLRSDFEPEGFQTRNQESALVVGGGMMPGNLIVKLTGRISTGSTLLPTQSSLHLMGHLCVGYRF